MESIEELNDEIMRLEHHKNKNELSEHGEGMLAAYLKCRRLVKKLNLHGVSNSAIDTKKLRKEFMQEVHKRGI